MSGYHQWADGDILEPGDIDEFLMGQTVMRFANATDRTGQLSSPSDGMRSYLIDTGLEYVYSNGAWAPVIQWVRKTAGNQSITSDDTLTNDTAIFFNLSKGVFRVEVFLSATGVQAGDLQVSWDFTGTLANSSRSCFGPSINTTNVLGNGTASTTNGVNRSSALLLGDVPTYGTDATNVSAIHEDLFLNVSAAGVLTMQWSQAVPNATATTLTVSSRGYATRLG